MRSRSPPRSQASRSAASSPTGPAASPPASRAVTRPRPPPARRPGRVPRAPGGHASRRHQHHGRPGGGPTTPAAPGRHPRPGIRLPGRVPRNPKSRRAPAMTATSTRISVQSPNITVKPEPRPSLLGRDAGRHPAPLPARSFTDRRRTMDVPKIVTDTTTQNWSRRRFMGGAVGVAALGSFAAACSATPTASVLVRAPSWPASGTSAAPVPALGRGRRRRRRRADQPALPGPEAVRARAAAAGRQADHAERVRPDGVLARTADRQGRVRHDR